MPPQVGERRVKDTKEEEAGVPEHRVSNKQTNEGVNNVRTVHYAVDTLEVRSNNGSILHL